MVNSHSYSRQRGQESSKKTDVIVFLFLYFCCFCLMCNFNFWHSVMSCKAVPKYISTAIFRLTAMYTKKEQLQYDMTKHWKPKSQMLPILWPLMTGIIGQILMFLQILSYLNKFWHYSSCKLYWSVAHVLHISDDKLFEILCEEVNLYHTESSSTYKISWKALKWPDMAPYKTRKNISAHVEEGRKRSSALSCIRGAVLKYTTLSKRIRCFYEHSLHISCVLIKRQWQYECCCKCVCNISVIWLMFTNWRKHGEFRSRMQCVKTVSDKILEEREKVKMLRTY
jgi:hypothetical protein